MPVSSVWDTWGDMFYPGGLLYVGMLGGYGRMMEALDRDQREVLADYPYFSNPAFAGPAAVDGDNGALLRAAIAEHDANFDMTDFITQLGMRGDALRHDPGFTTATIAPETYAAGIPTGACALWGEWLDGWGGVYGGGGAAVRCVAQSGAAVAAGALGPWGRGRM